MERARTTGPLRTPGKRSKPGYGKRTDRTIQPPAPSGSNSYTFFRVNMFPAEAPDLRVKRSPDPETYYSTSEFSPADDLQRLATLQRNHISKPGLFHVSFVTKRTRESGGDTRSENGRIPRNPVVSPKAAARSPRQPPLNRVQRQRRDATSGFSAWPAPDGVCGRRQCPVRKLAA